MFYYHKVPLFVIQSLLCSFDILAHSCASLPLSCKCSVLGFDSVWASGGRERARREETIEKAKSFSSPVARPGEEEEECRLKRHCFVFLSFFFVWGPKNR